MFERPSDFGETYLLEERLRVQIVIERVLKQRTHAAVQKWRQILNENVAVGAKEAFRYLRQDDDPDKAIASMGVGQVLQANHVLSAGLWCCPDREVMGKGGTGTGSVGQCEVGQEARRCHHGHRVQVLTGE